ncbi:MAG: prepilin-type N-terminal cleavage/methylation domain-containing protein [Planctomycetota bacterium]
MRLRTARATRAFTLVELLLALSLLSILVVALVNLIDTSLRIWGRTESERDLVEVSSAVLELLSSDLTSIEAGPRGDLLADWTTVDLDRDASPGTPMMRLRMVRRATEAELYRLGDLGREHDLLEIAWALLPNSEGTPGEAGSIGLLFRGERLVGADDTKSILADDFFNAVGKPPAGSMSLVTGGILWFELDFATQTSVVNDGWTVGDKPEDCATSWDAWVRGRPDVSRVFLNEPGAGMPAADDLPILPRRVKIKMEVERIGDLKRRARLGTTVETEAVMISIGDPDRAPVEGQMVLVDEEWMEVQAVSGTTLHVRRGARGTTPRQHDRGAVVHHGWEVEREVPIPLYREDWNL